MIRALIAWLCMSLPWVAQAGFLQMQGKFIQGGIIIGRTEPDTRLLLDGQPVPVSPEGAFLFGFGRDAPLTARLQINFAQGKREVRILGIKQRQYPIQRIDGLPPQKVTPPPEVLQRIKREAAKVAEARQRDIPEPYFLSGFQWPLRGHISGVYGSQRILNGQPRQPHYGVDISAPTGTPVRAPADGVVTLVDPDMYFSGGTLIVDHGQGLSSSFLHLSKIHVRVGQLVKQGDIIASVGATGRVTGSHLDWRMNWFNRRVDPTVLVPPM